MVMSDISLEPGEHKITFTVTIACAVQAVESDAPVFESKKGRRMAVYEAPKPQQYFHLEYKLMPDDLEPIKTDVVMYGVAAKIYTDNDSKVVRTWKEGEKIWIAWTQNVSVWVTKEFLLSAFEHSLDLIIWDSKEKVSTRARFDRPKAFRLPEGPENEEANTPSQNNGSSNVKALVLRQSISHVQLQLRESRQNKDRLAQTASGRTLKDFENAEEQRSTTAPSTITLQTPAPSVATKTSELAKVQVRMDENKCSQWLSIAKLAGLSEPFSNNEMILSSDFSEEKKRLSGEKEKRRMKIDTLEISQRGSRRKLKKEDQKGAFLAGYSRANGIATIKIRLALLFAGCKTVTERLTEKVNSLEDLMVSVSLDKPLLSEEQKKELNPMVIKLCSVSNLPNKPLSYKQLNEKCAPVFAQYKFLKQPLHRTLGSPHGRNVYWDDMNVVLLGVMDQGELQEFLEGPHLRVEVHDRDRDEKGKKYNADLFGDNPEDEMISNVCIVAGRRTLHNPFKGKDRAWDPYGVAKLDLSPLLLGQRCLHVSIPIHNYNIPDPTVGHDRPGGSVVGHAGSVDGPEDEPLPSANYIEAGSELKIKVEVAAPLITVNEVRERMTHPDKVENREECPFARLICIFDYSNVEFLKELQNEITEINSAALELHNLPEHIIEAALSTYKLSDEQKESKTLNIITGFQIIDGVRHMFVLEGLRTKGIKRLVAILSFHNKDDETVKALFKSDMCFSGRLYVSLDVDLCRVRLHDSLTNIMQKPLLYVRDIVPRPCFECLSRLDQILKASKLRDVVKNDLFPTTDMLLSASREFGVPLTREDFGEAGQHCIDEFEIDGDNFHEVNEQSRKRQWTPLKLSNPEYLEFLKNRRNSDRNFIVENVLKIHSKSKNKKPETVTACDSAAHNYSIQSLNSTELSKQKLRDLLNEDPRDAYTYCQDYNSASVELSEKVSADIQIRRDVEKKKWLTSVGFLTFCPRTALESNRHPLQPDKARVAELSKPWRENVLHGNILKPTVDRTQFPWKHRDKDMDTITRVPELKYMSSIHLFGETREREKRDAFDKDFEIWQSKLAVDDVRFRTHRCLLSTELRERGKKAANSISKLEDILKDRPQKFSLKEKNLKLEKIPPLSTLNGETGKLRVAEEVNVEHKGGFLPGPRTERSWLMEGNRVPTLTDNDKEIIKTKDEDFRLVFKPKSKIYQRPIKPLLPIERESYLFSSTTKKSIGSKLD